MNETHRSSLDLNHVKAMPTADARILLQRDASSWQTLEQDESLFINFEKQQRQLDLHVYAVQIGLVNHKSAIHEIVQRMQSIYIPETSVWRSDAITSLLQPPVSELDLFYLTKILQSMIARGHDLSLQGLRRDLEDIILVYIAEQKAPTIATSAYHHVRRLFNHHAIYAGTHGDVRSLYQCAHLGLWDEVWRIWREYPMAMRARPKELYCAILDCAASHNHQAKAIDCLRECVAEMEIEEPPIELDANIAQAIKKCLLVADPNAPHEAADNGSNAEWGKLWRQCTRVTGNSRLELD